MPLNLRDQNCESNSYWNVLNKMLSPKTDSVLYHSRQNAIRTFLFILSPIARFCLFMMILNILKSFSRINCNIRPFIMQSKSHKSLFIVEAVKLSIFESNLNDRIVTFWIMITKFDSLMIDRSSRKLRSNCWTFEQN